MEQIQYNDEQKNAVESQKEDIIVDAGAGMGKTSVLVGAIKKYKNEYPDARVVCITFTNAAADELKQRIGIKDVKISTIHSWASKRLDILSIEHGFRKMVLNDEQVKNILSNIAKSRGHYRIDMFKLQCYIQGNFNIDIDDRLKRTYEGIRKAYIKYKRENDLYDFTDYTLYLLDKLEEYDEEINDIDGFFVDEFQDISETELEIFNRVNAKKKFFIGDPNQAIYLFRGSLGDSMGCLKNFTTYELHTNYRSLQFIIDYAISFVKFIENNSTDSSDAYSLMAIDEDISIDRSGVDCARGTGGVVYNVPTKDKCYITGYGCDGEEVSSRAIMESLLSDPNTQILCRFNRQVTKCKNLGVREDKVSTIHKAKGLEYDNVILVDFPVFKGEELNVAYVGMTRAKNKLCIVSEDTLNTFLQRHNKMRSLF